MLKVAGFMHKAHTFPDCCQFQLYAWSEVEATSSPLSPTQSGSFNTQCCEHNTKVIIHLIGHMMILGRSWDY